MKNIIIAVLSVVVVVELLSIISMSERASYWMNRSDIADRYIEQLESDFPNYIDTTSGCDAAADYYEVTYQEGL